MCYITEAGKSALGGFVMLDKARISTLGGKRVKAPLTPIHHRMASMPFLH